MDVFCVFVLWIFIFLVVFPVSKNIVFGGIKPILT